MQELIILFLVVGFNMKNEHSYSQINYAPSVKFESYNENEITRPTINANKFVAEAMGGIVGGAFCGALTWAFCYLSMTDSPLLKNTSKEDISMYAIIPVVAIGFPFGMASGVSITGKIMKQNGSFRNALLGTYLGYGGIACYSYGVLITLPVGAVMGYNYKKRTLPNKRREYE